MGINMKDMMEEESLPDTLTPKDVVISPQGETDYAQRMPWGRLMACKDFLESVDLVDSDEGWTFGRSELCSMVITSSFFPRDLLINTSKIHFRIEREKEDNLIYITDMSKNGTFINRNKIGFGNKKILKSDDVIAVSLAEKSIYIFKSLQGTEDFLPAILIPKYAKIRPLGRGSCGDVHLVKDRDTFKQYAVKKIKLGESNSSQINKINHPTKINREIEILQSLSHPCVVKCEEVVECEREIYLILEYMAGGELFKRIVQYEMSEDTVKFYFLQMLYAVQYLHSKGVIHRDLKPQNILLQDHKQETTLKITDFGLSKITNESDMTTMCGTMLFVAPEVLDNRFREYGEYGKKVDVWSLGVILYFMASRTFPFQGENNLAVREKILNGAYQMTGTTWAGVSSDLKDLIQKILVVQPRRRANIFQIFYHPWIKNDYGVKFRVENLLQQQGLENPLEDLVLEPPEKKFKFNQYSSSSSDLNSTFVYNDSGSSSSHSCGSTMCY